MMLTRRLPALTFLLVVAFLLPTRAQSQTVLQPSDVVYEGFRNVQPNGPSSTYGKALTHRYVNGDLRFLTLSHDGTLMEFSIGSTGIGGTIGSTTATWQLPDGMVDDFTGKFPDEWTAFNKINIPRYLERSPDYPIDERVPLNSNGGSAFGNAVMPFSTPLLARLGELGTTDRLASTVSRVVYADEFSNDIISRTDLTTGQYDWVLIVPFTAGRVEAPLVSGSAGNGSRVYLKDTYTFGGTDEQTRGRIAGLMTDLINGSPSIAGVDVLHSTAIDEVGGLAGLSDTARILKTNLSTISAPRTARRLAGVQPPAEKFYGDLNALDIFARLLCLTMVQGFAQARVLESTLRMAVRLTHYRDPESKGHLERMAQCARLIARALAPVNDLSDEFVESVLRFAPMHDIGKIGIPDRILLKDGPLTPAECEVMQSHVLKGVEIVDDFLAEMDGGGIGQRDLLRNVVLFHHEAIDGSGYPHGCRGSDIPLEGRIVMVADVFDALGSQRPYEAA